MPTIKHIEYLNERGIVIDNKATLKACCSNFQRMFDEDLLHISPNKRSMRTNFYNSEGSRMRVGFLYCPFCAEKTVVELTTYVAVLKTDDKVKAESESSKESVFQNHKEECKYKVVWRTDKDEWKSELFVSETASNKQIERLVNQNENLNILLLTKFGDAWMSGSPDEGIIHRQLRNQFNWVSE